MTSTTESRPVDLTGRLYTKALVARHPARLFGCRLCARKARCWDHCHEHGTIRGPLCHGCNTVTRDADAGLGIVDNSPFWRNAAHRQRRGWPGWAADEPMMVSGKPPGAVSAFLAMCPQCTGQPTEVAQWVTERAARAWFRNAARDDGMHPRCARCPLIWHLNGIPTNPRDRSVWAGYLGGRITLADVEWLGLSGPGAEPGPSRLVCRDCGQPWQTEIRAAPDRCPHCDRVAHIPADGLWEYPEGEPYPEDAAQAGHRPTKVVTRPCVACGGQVTSHSPQCYPGIDRHECGAICPACRRGGSLPGPHMATLPKRTIR